MPPCIIVFPDCFTALGGNQYVNSTAIGRYADYLTQELIPFIDQQFRTKADRESRGCFGKSSGGYGAMIHGLKYPEYWGGIANHSGDAYFDFVYKSEWPGVLTHLQHWATRSSRSPNPPVGKQTKPGTDDGRVANFLQHCWNTQALSGQDIMAMMMICMAATYDPDPRAPNGFRLPYDLNTGEFLPRRWAKWVEHDPIALVKQYRKNLASLRSIYIDCGWRDQYHIHYGARQLSATLSKNKITHKYQEFDGTHSGVDYRLDVSLPALARKLR